ncbi:hypothetical protein [Pseudofrankia sp. BMG5.36]|uniref:hypothetical protein n=1 Tax=Pseudofrankia sp. BMG5.36 TaxID=1834512 RepID=UPI0008DACCFD|nr:hypothetical protein [Pseudofrankia sp. BMG5.36]OHV48902.1 hypothetical protein BCD48_13685 [Pseudofrankia sp. BMG5.36]
MNLLVAAHIKKRAACNEEERKDFDNVAMLACLLGCDGLYERGYVAVGPGGQLLVAGEVNDAPSVADYARDRLRGRSTSWWTSGRERYFRWHRDHTFRNPVGGF